MLLTVIINLCMFSFEYHENSTDINYIGSRGFVSKLRAVAIHG